MVMANLAAQQLLGAERLLLGQCAASVLPARLAPLWEQPGEHVLDFEWSGRRWRAPRPTFWCICPQGAFAGVQRIGLTIHARTDPDSC